VESADTGPFFHNHTVPDLEAAVAFYGSDAFKNSLVPSLEPSPSRSARTPPIPRCRPSPRSCAC
jgi:cytochrome c peroxidase